MGVVTSLAFDHVTLATIIHTYAYTVIDFLFQIFCDKKNSANFSKNTNAVIVVECFWNVHRKMPVLECLLNEVAGL